ncbi:MAG TPA: ParA family protein [Sporichthyaceae bacterium]|nr:ParA family protein [Sporichthyaceae bacterium]
MTCTLAVANQKGGVAKTTTVASLGTAFVELGKRVVVVDLDPQACLTFSLGLDPDELELSIHDVLLGRVPARTAVAKVDGGPDLLPAEIDLVGAEKSLATRNGHEFVLRKALTDLHDEYDLIILDAPPALGVLTVNALTAADHVLIPLQCETLAHRGVKQLLDTVDNVRSLTNRHLNVLGVLPTLFDGRSKHARAVLDDIGERYRIPVLEPAIPRSVRFAEAPAAGRSVLATASRSAGAKAYRELADRLLKDGVLQPVGRPR